MNIFRSSDNYYHIISWTNCSSKCQYLDYIENHICSLQLKILVTESIGRETFWVGDVKKSVFWSHLEDILNHIRQPSEIKSGKTTLKNRTNDRTTRIWTESRNQQNSNVTPSFYWVAVHTEFLTIPCFWFLKCRKLSFSFT